MWSITEICMSKHLRPLAAGPSCTNGRLQLSAQWAVSANRTGSQFEPQWLCSMKCFLEPQAILDTGHPGAARPSSQTWQVCLYFSISSGRPIYRHIHRYMCQKRTVPDFDTAQSLSANGAGPPTGQCFVPPLPPSQGLTSPGTGIGASRVKPVGHSGVLEAAHFGC